MVNVDYSNEVWCKHCATKHLKIHTKFIVNFGYKCPECGRRCRSKARTISKYTPVQRSEHTIPREIRGPYDRKEYQRTYNIAHPEVKQRFYENHPHYNRDYQREYRLVKEKSRME